MTGYFARLLLLTGLAVAAIAINAAWTDPVQAALRCDLAYEVLPADPAAVVGSEAGDALSALDHDARWAFTEAEAARLPELFALLPERAVLSLSPAQVTWGGWRGASSPAIHLELRAETAQRGRAAARSLAGLLGWIYRQDAVLLACDAPPRVGGAGLAPGARPAHRVVSDPPGLFLEREHLFGFFGATLAFAGHPDLGYTRLGEAFWSIDFTGDLEPALLRSAALFEDLSEGRLTFTLETTAVEAELPSNDWKEAAEGEGYLALMPGVDPAALAAVRLGTHAALLDLAAR